MQGAAIFQKQISWPLLMRNVRKLAIVGDVHLGREEWPSLPEEWENLWSIKPQPIKLSKITYCINKEEQCFSAISLSFREQTFQAYDLSATDKVLRRVCHVKQRHPIRTVKIKQRNNPQGISMICGLWLIGEKGYEVAKIDLSPGLGQWRVQPLNKHEHIIGLHSYVQADDENDSEVSDGKTIIEEQDSDQKDSSWLDSLGFIVYKFDVVQPPEIPKKPRGRPRKFPLVNLGRPDFTNNYFTGDPSKR